MTNIEYIYLFANKHNFPKTECEIIFNTPQKTDGKKIQYIDDDIKSVRFDKNLIENEINIEDIRFDVDSEFDNDIFSIWQKDNPKISFKEWLTKGKYTPPNIQNTDFLNEIDTLTKDIKMKLDNLFSIFEIDDGDSDFDEDEEDLDEDGEE